MDRLATGRGEILDVRDHPGVDGLQLARCVDEFFLGRDRYRDQRVGCSGMVVVASVPRFLVGSGRWRGVDRSGFACITLVEIEHGRT